MGNARVHSIALSVVSKIVQTNIAISKFTYIELLEIETTLLKRNVKINSVGVYMRSLCTICNKAINLDYVPLSWYPFRKCKIKKQKTIPRVMTLEELKAFFALDLNENHLHYQAGNVGKLLFILHGINIKDLLTLTNANVVNDRIIYKRCQTSKMYYVKVTDDMKVVFNTFTPSATLLGLHTDNNLTSPKRVQLQNQRNRVINNHLKKLGEPIL